MCLNIVRRFVMSLVVAVNFMTTMTRSFSCKRTFKGRDKYLIYKTGVASVVAVIVVVVIVVVFVVAVDAIVVIILGVANVVIIAVVFGFCHRIPIRLVLFLRTNDEHAG